MPFRNEPATDFSNPIQRQAMEQALAHVKQQLGRTYPLLIDDKAISVSHTFRSLNPSRFKETIGILSQAERTHADKALDAAVKAYESWSRESDEVHAETLRRMAGILRRRKLEFCAWIILEVGKNWAEADADVAEAIDFLEYYAECAMAPGPGLISMPGEKNWYGYKPLGVVVVIPPWNFPLAILVGMTVAAIACGNTVVLKPSGQSPVIACKFMEIVQEAGVPGGVVNLLMGAGSSVGEYLVQDMRTRMIAFTGSKAVGEHVNKLAAVPARGQRWIKRVIAEMGGKNAIVVDESADLDAAVQGILASAFGYQGQKCSACSRAYIHHAVYEGFIDRLLQKTKALRQGPADNADCFMGPVISQNARKSILQYMTLGKKEGQVLTGGHAADIEGGYFLEPTILHQLPARSRIWKEEIFGPVLAMAPVKTFHQGILEANHTDFGLTGAVYSRTPGHIALAKKEFFCGNLYINRKCTGALVGAHPFGGFNLSGTDSKAGGPDYLLLFRQAQTISEKQ